jgi:hypothetical protein
VSWPEIPVRCPTVFPEDATRGREAAPAKRSSSWKRRRPDPARRPPESPPGFFKGLLDDDGNRATAILTFDGAAAAPRASRVPDLLPAKRACRVGLPEAGEAGLGCSVSFPASAFDTEWGEDGALGQDVILRFHTFLDLPRRWAYLRPLDAGKVLSPSKN